LEDESAPQEGALFLLLGSPFMIPVSDGHNQIIHADLIDYLNLRIPPQMSEAWDNCGLQVGSRQWPLQGVLCCLDLSSSVVSEALAVGANFIFSHHPLFFKPLKSLDLDVFPGNLIYQALTAGITLYSAHTNLDSVVGGVNDHLAKLLGVTNCAPLIPHSVDIYKLVTFIPSSDLEQVAEALFAAGAGRLGAGLYSECSFSTPGVGSFRPASGATPRIGEIGKTNLVDEIRFETVLDRGARARVLKALHLAHPYEVPAYDLYPLKLSDDACGSGRVGVLKKTMGLAGFVSFVKQRLGIETLRLVGGDLGTGRVEKIALCGGSGFSLYKEAQAAGADLYITGDLKYHEAREVLDQGQIPILDAGHFATEKPILEVCAGWCHQFLAENEIALPVVVSQTEREPWLYL